MRKRRARKFFLIWKLAGKEKKIWKKRREKSEKKKIRKGEREEEKRVSE